MGNGGFPPLGLGPLDYTAMKAGEAVTSGPYIGCIKVDSTYHWISRGESSWVRHTGIPNRTKVSIGTAVWDKCKDGGTYTYEQSYGGWSYSSKDYKWNGAAGDYVELVEVEV